MKKLRFGWKIAKEMSNQLNYTSEIIIKNCILFHKKEPQVLIEFKLRFETMAKNWKEFYG